MQDNCCNHQCNQGRDCEQSRVASCMALGLHRIVQIEGNKGPKAELSREEADAIEREWFNRYTPESMGRAYAWLAVSLVSLGCFLLYALIVYLASKGAAS